MEKKNSFIRCSEVRNYDLVHYLASLGIEPVKIKGHSFWYLSPFRQETVLSFKVDRIKNRYYDFGEGKGGDLISFAIRFHNCTIREFLDFLSGHLSFLKPINQSAQSSFVSKENSIQVTQVLSLRAQPLLHYLNGRRIPVRVADAYCKQIQFSLYGKPYYAIGFKNNSGGCELRNAFFKASSSPKDFSSFHNGYKIISVFEGFFDFMSFLTLFENDTEAMRSDFLVLNSLAFFDRARPVMESYESIRLLLDNNTAGDNFTLYAKSVSSTYSDLRSLYQNYEDLNDYLCRKPIR